MATKTFFLHVICYDKVVMTMDFPSRKLAEQEAKLLENEGIKTEIVESVDAPFFQSTQTFKEISPEEERKY